MNKQINHPFRNSAKRHAKKYKLIIGVCLAAFVLLTGLYSCGNSSPKTNNQDQQARQTADSMTAAHDTLQSQYNSARMQVDDLTTRSYVLDSQVRQKDAEIAKLKSEVTGLRKKNKALSAKLKKDEEFLKSIEGEMSAKAKEFAAKLGLLQNDRDNIARERDSLLAKYHALKEVGSVLHASNIRVEGLHTKNNGKEKKTRKARKLNVLRITFDIDENRIAEDGTKQLYVAILAPDGNLLSNVNNKGTFTNSKGTSVNYSLEKDVALQQNQPLKDVTVDWEQEGDHKKGLYTITIYNGGYKVGSGSVMLK